MKRFLIKVHWLLATQFGFDPLRLWRSLCGLTHYLRDRRSFQRGYHGALGWMPCLHDRYEEGGTTKSEYFWQDLQVARWIHATAPRRHVDVGSRVDGFVAHVASFRQIEVLDVRPISSRVPGITFRQADLMDGQSIAYLTASGGGYCDSISCLHAIEHLGLGRYADPIDPQGYARGLANLAALLQPNGRLYLATPMGRERVEFNANRVFAPRTILSCAEQQGLHLDRLHSFRGEAGLVEHSRSAWPQLLDWLGSQPYQLVLCSSSRSRRETIFDACPLGWKSRSTAVDQGHDCLRPRLPNSSISGGQP
jgi:hypothetical protein